MLTVCVVVSGAEIWEDIEDYGRHEEQWLRRFIAPPNGVLSDDTIRRLFMRLDPSELERCFISWITAVRGQITGDVEAIDGKTIRRSTDAASGKSTLHMVSAWVSGNGVMPGKVETDDHYDEIPAIPAILETLRIRSCIVTIVAMGCQTEIAKKIWEKKSTFALR